MVTVRDSEGDVEALMVPDRDPPSPPPTLSSKKRGWGDVGWAILRSGRELNFLLMFSRAAPPLLLNSGATLPGGDPLPTLPPSRWAPVEEADAAAWPHLADEALHDQVRAREDGPLFVLVAAPAHPALHEDSRVSQAFGLGWQQGLHSKLRGGVGEIARVQGGPAGASAARLHAVPEPVFGLTVEHRHELALFHSHDLVHCAGFGDATHLPLIGDAEEWREHVNGVFPPHCRRSTDLPVPRE